MTTQSGIYVACILCKHSTKDSDAFIYVMPHAANATFACCASCIFGEIHAKTARGTLEHAVACAYKQ